jgi:hypothetical protein
MKKLVLFNSKTNLFNEKAYKKEIKKEKELQKKLHKQLQKKQKEEEKKRKLLEKINKKKRSKNIPKHRNATQSKTRIPKLGGNQPKGLPWLKRQKNIPKHNAKATSNIRTEHLCEKYDENTKQIKELHEKLQFLGLTEKGLKKIPKETEKHRKKRIIKINKIHSELIEKIEQNKNIEKKLI